MVHEQNMFYFDRRSCFFVSKLNILAAHPIFMSRLPGCRERNFQQTALHSLEKNVYLLINC